MSAMHKLKAYFGMVPADDYDDYDEYDPDYGTGYDDEPEDIRSRVHSPARPAPRRTPRLDLDDSPRAPFDPEPLRSTRRPSWSPEAAVRGSLAVDTAPPVREPVRESIRESIRAPFSTEDSNPLSRIVTLHPRNYNEARPIGERYREGTPVIMNLTEMDDGDAKRLVDFAAGLAFAMRGAIDKVTNKVFLLSPPNVEVSAEDKRRLAEGGFFNQS